MRGCLDRCTPLTAPGLYSVLSRARASDLADYLAIAGEPLDPHHEAATVATASRYGAVILDRAGQPQAAVGALPAEGAWVAWVHATDGWPDVWRAALRYLRDVMAVEMIADGIKRCEAFVLGPRPSAVRFLQACGFAVERVLPGVARDGQAMAVMARLA